MAEPGENTLASGARGSILVVDDEPVVLRSLARVLSNLPNPVETCSSGLEAVERVSRGGVEVVVSDISMPAMSGLELLRAIRQHDVDLPVVLVTGEPAVESASKAVEYGAFRYVLKPVDPDALLLTVNHALKLYRLAVMKREALNLLGVEPRPSDRAGLEATFERALGELWVAFQPIVRASDRSVYGYEALLRSNDPALPRPLDILDAAERLGELSRLGRAIRARAAEPMQRAPVAGVLFVNLHPLDLSDPDLTDEASALGSIAGRVVLEITERAALGNIENLRGTVSRLRDIGFRIAIDDLGAGYAGLTSFALLEPEIVKVDMTLVREIDLRPVKQKLVASMTALCQDMGLEIVAEGVETRAELETLVDLGCDLFQGYLFARPGKPFPSPRWEGAPPSSAGRDRLPSSGALRKAAIDGTPIRDGELAELIVPWLSNLISQAEAACQTPDELATRRALDTILVSARSISQTLTRRTQR